MNRKNSGLSPVVSENQHSKLGECARLKASNFWQAAFVRPFPKSNVFWSPGLKALLAYAFGLFFLWVGASSLVNDVLTWPTELDKMDRHVGVLTAIHVPKRGAPHFVLRESGGNEIRYSVNIFEALKLQKSRNALITVWSQQGFRLIRLERNAIEVRLDKTGRYVFEYGKYRDRLIQRDERDHWWYWGMLLLGIFLISLPWLKHRKPISQIQHPYQA